MSSGAITQQRLTSSYDLDNHVTSVDDGTHRTTYTIDPAGDRTAADTTAANAPGRHTDYAWDDNNPLPMLVSERSTEDVRSYSYNPDGSPLALQTGGAGYLYQPDPFGNTAELTGTDGAVQREYTMTDPFGAFTETTPGGPTAPASRLGFDGQYQDPTSGTYHLSLDAPMRFSLLAASAPALIHVNWLAGWACSTRRAVRLAPGSGRAWVGGVGSGWLGWGVDPVEEGLPVLLPGPVGW